CDKGSLEMMITAHFSLEELTASECRYRQYAIGRSGPQSCATGGGFGTRAGGAGQPSHPCLKWIPVAEAESTCRRFKEFHAHPRSGGGYPLPRRRVRAGSLPCDCQV